MEGTLSYDGKGINGPDQYRRRMFTARAADDAEDQRTIDGYGRMFEAAPEMLKCTRWLLEIAGNLAECGDFALRERYAEIAEEARATLARIEGA